MDRMTGCRPLTQREVVEVLGVLGARDRTLALVCLHLGTRLQEALNLNVEDVAAWEGAAWRVRPTIALRRAATKGAIAGRSIGVHEELQAALVEHLGGMDRRQDGDRPVFRSSRGGRLSRSQAWRPLHAAMARLADPTDTGTHSLRKTFATRLHQAGTSLVEIQLLLGHADPRTTVTYLGLDRTTAIGRPATLPGFTPMEPST